jgi:hypothetical protein
MNLDNPSTTEAILSLSRDSPVPGDTPEERLENFMAGFTHLPPDEVAEIREMMRAEFGAPAPDLAHSAESRRLIAGRSAPRR